MKYPIIFIHGFGGSAREYRPILRYLAERGSLTSYEFSYKERFGQVSLRDIAWQLHLYIQKHVMEERFDIVALSQGGIIARCYIGSYANKRVRTCVTVCTPHAGSFLANIGVLPGIIELKPASKFLAELDTSSADYYTVYNPLDLMVFPGWNAKLACAKGSMCVRALLHPLTFSAKATLDFIYSSLSV